MKPFEDVFTGWNCAARIADGQHSVSGVALSADPDPPAGSIVLSRVLQEILHNERRVLFFASYEQAEWKFFFDLHIRRIGKRAKIVDPLIDELAKIYWCRCDLKMTSIHARQKKQIVNYAGQTMRLMEQGRQLLVNLRLKILACQQRFDANAKHGNWAFQL